MTTMCWCGHIPLHEKMRYIAMDRMLIVILSCSTFPFLPNIQDRNALIGNWAGILAVGFCVIQAVGNAVSTVATLFAYSYGMKQRQLKMFRVVSIAAVGAWLLCCLFYIVHLIFYDQAMIQCNWIFFLFVGFEVVLSIMQIYTGVQTDRFILKKLDDAEQRREIEV